MSQPLGSRSERRRFFRDLACVAASLHFLLKQKIAEGRVYRFGKKFISRSLEMQERKPWLLVQVALIRVVYRF
jgi:hypothetical protein